MDVRSVITLKDWASLELKSWFNKQQINVKTTKYWTNKLKPVNLETL